MCFHDFSVIFYYSVSYREYAAPPERGTCERPLALDDSGLTPSVTSWIHADRMRISETCLFRCESWVCMPAPRPDLSMRKTPAWYSDPWCVSMESPPSPPTTTTTTLLQRMRQTSPTSTSLFSAHHLLLRRHRARPVWLNSRCVGFLFNGAKLTLLVSSLSSRVFCKRLLLQHSTKPWRFVELPNLAATALNRRISYFTVNCSCHIWTKMRFTIKLKRKMNVYMSHIENLY